MYHLAEYPLALYNGKLLANNLIKIRVKELVARNISFFEEYTVQDGELLDHLAYDFYGNSRHNWTLAVINNIIDPFHDWPLQRNALRLYLIEKYLGSDIDPDEWHHFEDENGQTIADPGTDELRAGFGISNFENEINKVAFYRKDGNRIVKPVTEADQNLYEVTFLQHEEELNELKRDILIVQVEYIGQIESELKEILRNVA